MRKFYSLVLIAAGLLIGTNAWGQVSSVQLVNHDDATKSKNYPTLQKAIDAIAPGQHGTITLLDEQNLEAQVVIPNVLGEDNATYTARGPVVGRPLQHITLDLNGNDINGADKKSCIVLVKGELNITGEGTIQKQGSYVTEGSAFNRAAIVVLGAPGNKNEASLDHSKEWWSILTIDENVKLYSGTVKTFGLSIADIGSNYASHKTNPGLGYNGNNIDGASSWLGTREKLGYTTYNQVPAGKNKQPQPVTSDYDLMWGRNITSSGAQEQGSAFGVKIIVKGEVYGYSRGINVLGHVNQHPSAFPTLESNDIHKETRKRYEIGNEHPYYYEHYFPWITLTSTAKVHCVDGGITNDEACGIYSSGWAVLDISGEVYGQNGAYLKGGDLKLNDANIYSTSSHGATSGVADTECSGNGIFISTDPAYAHDITVDVNGDSRIAGNGGVAITDVVANISTEPDVNYITINGGTIEGGSLGAIIVTENTGENTIAYGGTNITGVTQKGGTEASVAASGTYATEVTDPQTNKTTIVISDLGAGNSVEIVTENLTDTEEDYVKWTGTADQYILEDMTLEYLEMNPSPAVAQKIYVGDATHQATLTVDRVVMGSLAQIIVAPGSSLVVKGEDGIVAPNVSNIILQHEGAVAMADRKHATFLFNPAVSSNKHPNATVELTTYSFRNGSSDYQWERFGVPTYEAVKAINSVEHSVPTAFSVFENGAWVDLGYVNYPGHDEINVADFNKPFATYELLANRGYDKNAPSVGPKYTFAGKLVGNDNATLNVNTYWTPFTNSYSASIDVPAMWDVVKAGQIVDEFIYIATPGGLGTYTWKAVDSETDGYSTMKLAPMQAFILKKTLGSTQTEDVVLNYKDMVYDPSPATAPARRVNRSSDFSARMVITVENENGVWDELQLRETATNVKAAEKYMNADVNIYATTDMKDAILATENLENTYVGFSTVKGGQYTISFANVEGREFTLIDHETGARVLMVEGNTYEFTAAANATNDYRFEIVESAKMPTAIENAEAVKSAKGIYTITGQYLGEMNVWNSLPAGVYVVNGEKRVK